MPKKSEESEISGEALVIQDRKDPHGGGIGGNDLRPDFWIQQSHNDDRTVCGNDTESAHQFPMDTHGAGGGGND